MYAFYVPNLRFPEFQGEWEESSIGEMFDLYSGNTPSRLNKEHFRGTINWISSGELKEHYIYSSKEQNAIELGQLYSKQKQYLLRQMFI